MANRAQRKDFNEVPFKLFCKYAGDILDKEMNSLGVTPLNAAAMLDKDFGISKQTAYNRILQLGKASRMEVYPNITLKILCAILDAFGLEIVIKRKNSKSYFKDS